MSLKQKTPELHVMVKTCYTFSASAVLLFIVTLIYEALPHFTIYSTSLFIYRHFCLCIYIIVCMFKFFLGASFPAFIYCQRHFRYCFVLLYTWVHTHTFICTSPPHLEYHRNDARVR